MSFTFYSAQKLIIEKINFNYYYTYIIIISSNRDYILAFILE